MAEEVRSDARRVYQRRDPALGQPLDVAMTDNISS